MGDQVTRHGEANDDKTMSCVNVIFVLLIYIIYRQLKSAKY